MDISLNIGDGGTELHKEVYNYIKILQYLYPLNCTFRQNVNIKPEGRVCVYTMNCLKYTH